MSDIPLGYIAGILDANAIFRIRKTPGGTELPCVAVHGLPLPIMKVLAEYTGTKVTMVTRDFSRQPCALHCEQKHSHVVSVSGRWSVTGARATVLIHAVLPHLQAQRVIATEVMAVGLSAPKKSTTYTKMAQLGWPIPKGPDEGKQGSRGTAGASE